MDKQFDPKKLESEKDGNFDWESKFRNQIEREK
jgi:hypothetical protein